MTHLEITSLNLRLLKGAPISVIVALLIERRPVTERRLSMMTGYSENTVRRALYVLEELRFVTRNERCAWQIGNFQLPLMQDAAQDVAQDADNAQYLRFDVKLSKKDMQDDLTEEPPYLTEEQSAIFALMQELGFYGTPARRVAAMPHITRRLILYHATTAPNLNMALWRIKCNWAVPPAWQEPIDREQAFRDIYNDSCAMDGSEEQE